MRKKIFFFFLLLGVLGGTLKAQINYGTTGLMNMPTADMQRDKTFIAGGNWLSHHATVPRWWYDTWNYYINITIFPWLEAGYLCMGTSLFPRITVISQVIGYRPNMVSSQTKTALFIFACVCGKKGGGNRGLPRLYWVPMMQSVILGMVALCPNPRN